MKGPFFSIFLPVYNAEKYIRECLDSIVNQSFKDFELYIHDDNSKDSSYSICEEYASKYSNIFLSRSYTEESSYVCAQNEFVYNAQGKYIVFIDNDDRVDRNYLEVVWKKLSTTEADCAIVAYKHIDENGNLLRWYEPQLEDGRLLSSEEARALFFMSYDIEGFRWNKICLKSVYIDNNIEMKDEFPGDVQFTYKVLSSIKYAVLVSDKLYSYRQRGDSEIGIFRWENCIGFLKCHSEMCKIADNQGLGNCGENYRIVRMIDVVYDIRRRKKIISRKQWVELIYYCKETLVDKNLILIWSNIYHYSKKSSVRRKLYIKAVLCKILLLEKIIMVRERRN